MSGRIALNGLSDLGANDCPRILHRNDARMDMTAIPATSENDANEESWELPSSWCWAKIDRVAPVNPSTTFDGLPDDAELPFIPMAAVAEETGLIDLSARRPVSAVAKGYVRFQQGDVLFAKITPCMENGKVAPVPSLAEHFGAGSTEFHVLRPLAVEQRYLWYWLVSRRFRHIAQRNMSGSAGQLRVPTAFVRDSLIPLAPTAEQGRIVERIDSLFAEIAEGEAALEDARKGLETFRRTLLKAAVTGELTRDWRDNNQPNETGHGLLARIKAECGATPKLARGKKAAASPPLDTSDLPELPEGWAWARLGQLLSHLTSGSRDWAEYYDKGSKVFVMAQNVRPGRFNHAYTKHVDPPNHLKDVERSRIQRDDLLITIVGANTGDLCRVDFNATDYFVCQSVALMRPALAELSEYLEIYLIAPDSGRRDMQKVIYGAGRPHLSFDQIEALPIPLPPPAEMLEILRRTSELLGAYSDTLMMLEAETADAARLRQAILKSAFEGTLVPQNPADEPASTILERLQQSAQRAKAGHRGLRKARNGG